MIDNLRKWIAICEASGVGVPEQVHQFDAYGRLLESEIVALRAKLSRLEAVLKPFAAAFHNPTEATKMITLHDLRQAAEALEGK